MLGELASRLPAPVHKKVMSMEEAELNRTLIAYKNLLSQPYTGGEDIYDILRMDKASIIAMASTKRLETKNRKLTQIQIDLIEDLIKEDQFTPEQQRMLANPVGLATLRDILENKIEELRAKGAYGQTKPDMIMYLVSKRVEASAPIQTNANMAGTDLNTLWSLVIGPNRNIQFLQSIGVNASQAPYDYVPYIMDYGDSNTVLNEQQIDLIHHYAVLDRVNLLAAINAFIPIMVHVAKHNAIRLSQSTMAQDPIFHMYLKRAREVIQVQLRLKFDEVMGLGQIDLAEKLYISKGHQGITPLPADEILTDKEYKRFEDMDLISRTAWFKILTSSKIGVPATDKFSEAFAKVLRGSNKFKEIIGLINLYIASPTKLLNILKNFQELILIYPYVGLPIRSTNLVYSLAYLYGYIYSLKGRYYLQPQGTLHVNKINKDTVAAYKRHYYRTIENTIRQAAPDNERRSFINSRLNLEYIINGDFNKELSTVATPLSMAAVMYLCILNESERNTIKDEYYQIISQIPTGYDRTLRSLVWGFPYKSATELDTIIERMQNFMHIPDEKKEMLFELYGLTTIKELAGAEYHPLEQFIMAYVPHVNIDDIIKNLGIHVPPGTNPDEYFRDNFTDYKNAVLAHVRSAAEGRQVISKNVAELLKEPDEIIRSELQNLSDQELIVYTGSFITYVNRADMIERYLYLLRNRGAFYPVTRRCQNKQTTDLSDIYREVKDAAGNIVSYTNSETFMTGYGSVLSYTCQEPSEFETTFNNVNGVVKFRLPDVNARMIETLEQIPLSEVRFLKRIYQWFINQVRDPAQVKSMENIIRFINENQQYYKNNDVEKKFIAMFNTFDLINQNKLKVALQLLFKVGMIMRRWDECGNYTFSTSATRVSQNKLAVDIEFKKKNLEEEAKLPKYKGLSQKDLIVSIRKDIEGKLIEESGRDFGASHLYQRVMSGIENIFLTFNSDKARVEANTLTHVDLVLNNNPTGIEDFFRRLPQAIIIDGDYTIMDLQIINTILTEVYTNDLCIRIASNYCVATAAYYLGIFFNEDIPQL